MLLGVATHALGRQQSICGADVVGGLRTGASIVRVVAGMAYDGELPDAVGAAIADYPDAVADQKPALRTLVLEVASATEGVGKLTEEPKWG
jgi:hypothetical protein